VAEYTRKENLNTVDYWDKSWTRIPEGPDTSRKAQVRVMEILEGLPRKGVVEFGFGHLQLAEQIGRERWEGRDFSPVAVAHARGEGYSAFVTRAGDSPGYRKRYVVALSVLEHLDYDEMIEFLEKSRNAPHAIFTVPICNERIDVQKHMRGWDRHQDFAVFLKRWWKHVHVEVVGRTKLLAHCSKTPPKQVPLLTIGCSAYATRKAPDGFAGTMFTFASLMVHHGTFGGKVEFVLVDNHPDPKTQQDREEIEDMAKIGGAEGARIIRWSEKQGTYPGKNQLKVEALGKWVWTMDNHVLLPPRAVDTALQWIDENPESDDLIQFANIFRSNNPNHPGRPAASDYRNQNFIYHDCSADCPHKTKRENPCTCGGVKRKGGVYGWSKQAQTPGEPYPIAAMITSCYLVRKAAWFSGKGYEPILGNYGGWEGPIQLKWWLMGRKVLSMPYRNREWAERYGSMHHWHQFNNNRRCFKSATDSVHTGKTKQRNFAASSAVIGGEAWVRRHCELKGWDFNAANIQEGMREGLKLRPWMIENLARPEWEDITVFFKWMLDQGIPGALTSW